MISSNQLQNSVRTIATNNKIFGFRTMKGFRGDICTSPQQKNDMRNSERERGRKKKASIDQSHINKNNIRNACQLLPTIEERITFNKQFLQHKEINEEEIMNKQIRKIFLKSGSFLMMNIQRTKEQFPLILQTMIYYGKIEMYISREQYPCADTYDYVFRDFSQFPEIDYTQLEQKLQFEVEQRKRRDRFTLEKNEIQQQPKGISRINIAIVAYEESLFTINPVFKQGLRLVENRESEKQRYKQKIQELFKAQEEERVREMFERESRAVKIWIVQTRASTSLKSKRTFPHKIANRYEEENEEEDGVRGEGETLQLKKLPYLEIRSQEKSLDKCIDKSQDRIVPKDQIVHVRELKKIRNKFTRDKGNLEANDAAFLKAISKKEKELDIWREQRVKREILTLKQQFQLVWMQILSFALLLKVIYLKFQTKKRQIQVEEIFIQRIINTILLLKKDSIKLGFNSNQRVFSNTFLILKMRCSHVFAVNLEKAEKNLKDLLQDFSQKNLLLNKMKTFASSTIKVQRAYKEFQLRKQDQILQIIIILISLFIFLLFIRQLCELWDVAQQDLLGCEMGCFGKGYIDKMVFAQYKDQLEDVRYDTLKELFEEQLTFMIEGLTGYYNQFRYLRRVDKILISFLNHMETNLLKTAVSKKIQLQYFEENGERLTPEFFLQSLSHIQKFNIYVFKEVSLSNNLYQKLSRGQSKPINAHNIFSQDKQTIFDNSESKTKNQQLLKRQKTKKEKKEQKNSIISGFKQNSNSPNKFKPSTDLLARMLLAAQKDQHSRKTFLISKGYEEMILEDHKSDSSFNEQSTAPPTQKEKVLSFYFSKPFLNYMIELNQMQLLICKQLSVLLHPNRHH